MNKVISEQRSQNNHKCNSCGKTFSSNRIYNAHKCESFYTWTKIHNDALKDCLEHYPMKTNGLNKFYLANICERWRNCFKSSSSVTEETLIQKIQEALKIANKDPQKVHDASKDHLAYEKSKRCICNLCEKSFSDLSNLKRHKYTVHEGHKDFKCESCHKAFSSRFDLKKHIYIHEGRKDYKCESCEKLFSQKWLLKTHISRVHECHKDYKCESCDKLFTDSSYLKKHKRRIHDHLKDYKCDLCGKLFTDPSYLQKHKRRMHDGNNRLHFETVLKNLSQVVVDQESGDSSNKPGTPESLLENQPVRFLGERSEIVL